MQSLWKALLILATVWEDVAYSILTFTLLKTQISAVHSPMKLSLTPVFIHLVDFSSRASKYLVGQVILVPWKHWLPRIESATLLNFALKFKRKWFDTLVFANKTKIFAWEEETQSALPKPPRHKAVAITESAWYLHVAEHGVEAFHIKNRLHC